MQQFAYLISVESTFEDHQAKTIPSRCPHCSHNGAFAAERQDADYGYRIVDDEKRQTVYCASVRICPNRECKGVVFFIYNPADTKVPIDVYPPVRVEWNADGIPPTIAKALFEAIGCYTYKFYTSCAIMIRRTLEELCADKGCIGKGLHERLKTLGSTIIIPVDLLSAAFELKLLGNDAAHIEAKHYAQIGAKECAAGLRLTQELLKAVYQYERLLQELKAASGPSLTFDAHV